MGEKDSCRRKLSLWLKSRRGYDRFSRAMRKTVSPLMKTHFKNWRWGIE
jgi:hypothetical protein